MSTRVLRRVMNMYLVTKLTDGFWFTTSTIIEVAEEKNLKTGKRCIEMKMYVERVIFPDLDIEYRIENQKSSYIHTGMFKILYNFIDLWKKKVPKVLQFYQKH